MSSSSQPPPRTRRRLARTFARSRWREYERLLSSARDLGYQLVSLEDWVLGDPPAERLFAVRHDVDQHPRSALAMAAIENDLGVRSTWYFRWRTADGRVIDALRSAGHAVGLHYETLTRAVLAARNPAEAASPDLVEESRGVLHSEIALFGERFGSIRSAAPHGDSRVPGVSNASLLKAQDPRRYGIEFDSNEAMRQRRPRYWLTDRTSADGGWKDGVDPTELLARAETPILCLTHPNNWASGSSLWLDRVLAAVLPAPTPGRNRFPVRTGSDEPPGSPRAKVLRRPRLDRG